MFDLTQPKPSTLRGKVERTLYRIAERIPTLPDRVVVIAALLGYTLAVLLGWPQ